MKAKEPTGRGWQSIRSALGDVWSGPDGVTVISSLHDAQYPSGEGSGPQWHVSISQYGRRPTRAALRATLRAFGMLGAEEDNHHPGMARHYWRPVDPAQRVTCECKATETVVVDGPYRWTNPTDGACRGCEFQKLVGQPCPLHRGAP